MGRRVRELEQALSQKETELNSLRQQVAELGATVEKYRYQESAIAGALTKAQAAGERIIQEAEEENAAILRRAADDKREAELEARGLIEDAQRRAALIEEEAKQKARQTAARAEGFMENYRTSAQKLVAEFRKTATMAADQATRFVGNMNELERGLDQSVEITHEYDHLSAMHETPAQDMPDDYTDPASLMRSIYAIEQRDLPELQEEPEPILDADPQMELPLEEEPEPETVWQEHKTADPFTSWAGSLEQSEAVAQPWGKETISLDDRDDGRVWTVEEIVERTSADGNAEIDDELNAIIEDVLRGS